MRPKTQKRERLALYFALWSISHKQKTPRHTAFQKLWYSLSNSFIKGFYIITKQCALLLWIYDWLNLWYIDHKAKINLFLSPLFFLAPWFLILLLEYPWLYHILLNLCWAEKVSRDPQADSLFCHKVCTQNKMLPGYFHQSFWILQ